MKSISIRMDDPLWEALRALAFDERKSINRIVVDQIVKRVEGTYPPCRKCHAGFMIAGVCTACEGKGGE